MQFLPLVNQPDSVWLGTSAMCKKCVSVWTV
jgi:hypothetical protein